MHRAVVFMLVLLVPGVFAYRSPAGLRCNGLRDPVILHGNTMFELCMSMNEETPVRYVSRVMYDGTRYNGWQYQKRTRTIQSTIEEALARRYHYEKPVRVTGAGRTDAGVHARGQAMHFDLKVEDDPRVVEHSLNSMLPPDIRVWNVSVAPPPLPKNLARGKEWHVIYNADAKLYSYRININKVLDPLDRLYRHHIYYPIEMDKLYACIPKFLGTKDFGNFANRLVHKAAMENREIDTVRTIHQLQLVDEGDGNFRFDFELDGALYRMVRNIVGTMLLVAEGELKEEEIDRIFASKFKGNNPVRAAPAHGLTLERVYFPDY